MREIDTHTANTHITALECTHEAGMDVNATVATVDELDALIAELTGCRDALAAAVALAQCDHAADDAACPMNH